MGFTASSLLAGMPMLDGPEEHSGPCSLGPRSTSMRSDEMRASQAQSA